MKYNHNHTLYKVIRMITYKVYNDLYKEECNGYKNKNNDSNLNVDDTDTTRVNLK